MRSLLPSLTLASAGFFAVACLAQAGAPGTKNWFDDPFFQVSHAVQDCATPAGPFISEAERRVQAHHRAEKGTSCWLSGPCDKPNAYAYDREIAEQLRVRLAEQTDLLAHSSLWVTVQGRVVFVEGCSTDPRAASRIEALARGVPNVQQAVAIVYAGGPEPAPYRVRGPR